MVKYVNDIAGVRLICSFTSDIYKLAEMIGNQSDLKVLSIKDYIKIRYAGTDMLFVPVTQLDLVSKYVGVRDDANVRLNKLNSVEWQKTRQRVKKAVEDMAKELTELYAKAEWRSRATRFRPTPTGRTT